MLSVGVEGLHSAIIELNPEAGLDVFPEDRGCGGQFYWSG
jgi:hypothetical protein